MKEHFLRTHSKTRYLYLIFFCFFIISDCIAQADKIRIACIGNSITFGARVSDPKLHSYPAFMAAMLERGGYANYEVRNFGIGGATVIRYGQPNIWAAMDSMRVFKPDIMIIEVGTNETVSEPRFNWEHIGDFEKDYYEYLEAIRNISPGCRFILCSPLDMVIQTKGLSSERISNLTERRPRVWELRKRIRKIAKSQHAFFIDLTTPFKGRTDLMTEADGVHPNKDGYEFLAKSIFTFLVNKGIVVK